MVDQIRAFREANRINPGNLFGKSADTFTGKEGQRSVYGQSALGRRPEASGWERALMFFIGKSLYTLDPERMRLSKLSRNKARAVMSPAHADYLYEVNDLIDFIDVPEQMVNQKQWENLRFQFGKQKETVKRNLDPELWGELDLAQRYAGRR
jgi:RNA-splicing ligase RtcB